MSTRLSALLAIGLAASLGPMIGTTRPAGVISVDSPCVWQIIPSEDPHPALIDRFTSVAAVAPKQAWATGDFFTGHEGGQNGAFVERWDGRRWQVADTPIAPGANLWSVSASGRDDVWVAGATESGTQLFEHWNGTRWEQGPARRIRGGLSFSVSVRAHTDAWAVGTVRAGGELTTLTERWDGTRWTVVPSPNPSSSLPGRYAILLGVTAISPHDVWAAGYWGHVGSDATRTLIEHWDGRSWTIVPSPDIRSRRGVLNNILFSISGSGRDDVWAVGTWGSRPNGYGGAGDHALALHWDGSSWSRVEIPALEGRSLLSSVATDGEQVWAVGDHGLDPARRPLILRWDGARLVPTATPPGAGVALASVVIDKSGKLVWAVGAGATTPLAARCHRTPE